MNLQSTTRFILFFAIFCLFFPIGFDVSFQELTIAQAIPIVMLPFCMISIVRAKEISLGGAAGERVIRAGIFILIVIFISIYNASSYVDVIRYCSRYIYGISFAFMIIVFIKDKSSVNKFDQYFIFGSAAVALICVFSMFVDSLNEVVTHRSGRYQGFFRHPNSYAIALSCSLPIVLTKLQVAKGRARMLYLSAFLLHLLAIVLTGSKFNLALSVLVLIVVYQMNSDVKLNFSKMLVGLIASSVLSLFLIASFFYYLENYNVESYDKIIKLINDPLDQETIMDRLEIWSVGLAQTNYFFGYGAGHVPHYFNFSHLHNAFLDFYFSMGLLGLAALVYFYRSLIFLHIDTMKSDEGRKGRVLVSYSLLPLVYIISNQMSGSMGPNSIIILWAAIARIISERNLGINNEA